MHGFAITLSQIFAYRKIWSIPRCLPPPQNSALGGPIDHFLHFDSLYPPLTGLVLGVYCLILVL